MPSSRNRPSGFRFVTRRDFGESEWNDFWRTSLGRQFWQQWDVCEALDRWDDRRDASFAVISPRGVVAAILPGTVQDDKARGVSRLRTFFSLGGLAYSPDVRDMDGLARQVLRITSHSCKSDVSIIDPRPFGPGLKRTPSQVAPLASHMIGIDRAQWISTLAQPVDSLWKAMEGRSRTTVRKAERSGVKIRIAGHEDLGAVVRIHHESLIRNGQEPRTPAYWHLVWERMVGSGQAVCFLAEIEGETIGVQLFAMWEGGAYYWMAATTPVGNRLGANNLTHWEAMKWLSRNGASTLVHGDAILHEGSKAESLSRFRQSFGGEMRRYAMFHRFGASPRGLLARLGSSVRSR